MTASELYNMVGNDPEVWDRYVKYHAEYGFFFVPGTTESPTIVELILEAAYARAIEAAHEEQTCVTMMYGDQGGWEVNGETGRPRLRALVAAYRAGREKK